MALHGKELSEDLKKRIVALHKDGLGYKKIAKTLKLCCSMVAKTIQRLNRTGSTQNRPRHGQPKKLSACAQHHIPRLALGNRRMSATSIAAEVEGVKEAFLKTMHKKARKQFAEDKQTKDMDYWNRVLWSDETKINLFGSDGVKHVWRQPGEEYKDNKRGGGSVMVWSCMSAAGIEELQFIEGTLKANMYCDILKQSMIPSLRRLGRRAVFQHDNDPKHTSKMTTALLNKLRVKVTDWPSMSPDLNPIEHLWGILKRKVEERKVSNIHQLSDVIMEEWKRTPVATCEALTINTVSEVIRGCQMNQDYFASVNAPSNPPRPAIVVLLMSMVNERQPFVLRCAVLYCFQCFLYKNQKGQGEIVSTLLPSTIDATGNSVSAGQLLCGGLFSTDSLSNWCAAVALAHALQENAALKEQLLRVQLATSIGNPPVSLLQQCTNILSQGDKIDRRGSKVQTRVGLLMLLCTWLSNCPIAVTHFLHNPANIPFLTGQIAENLGEDEQLVQGLCALLLGISIYYNDNSLENYKKEKLKQLIEKRIGKENFIEKLGFISKHEFYSRAAQKPQPSFSSPDHMMFDHEFTKLVKELEGVLTKAVYKSTEEDKKEEEVKKTLEQHDNIVTHYKNVIRVQDQELEELRKQVETLKAQNEQLQTAVTQQVAQIQQHKDQYNLLKVQLGKDNQHLSSHSDVGQMNGVQPEEISKLHEEIEEWKHKLELLQEQLREKDTLIETLKLLPLAGGTTEQSSQTNKPSGLEADSELCKEVETLRTQNKSQSTDIIKLQAEKQELLQKLIVSLLSEEHHLELFMD
ncbi:hypothetical protein EYD10_14251 [Varanus komodoensis]|nr:hypothetical protein EYD10_14251 [Varanus komodoensis]